MRVTVGLWRCALQTLGAERAAYGSGDGHEAGVALAALAPSVCQAMLCAAQGCRPGVEHLFYPWCRLFERAWDSPRAGSACLLHRLAEAAAYIMLRAALLLAQASASAMHVTVLSVFSRSRAALVLGVLAYVSDAEAGAFSSSLRAALLLARRPAHGEYPQLPGKTVQHRRVVACTVPLCALKVARDVHRARAQLSQEGACVALNTRPCPCSAGMMRRALWAVPAH